MSRKTRDDGTIQLTPAADYSSKRGYLATFAAGTATVSASNTVIAAGVILEGNDTAAGYATEKVSLALLGATKGTVPMRASGSITAGDLVMQSTDGTILTDSTSGARVIVGRACETGVSGENIEVAPLGPMYYSA
jgi:hypothetical protein